MTKEEEIFCFIQEVIREVPVMLLGSGASCASGIPGMWGLGEYLNEEMKKTILKEEWNEVYKNIELGLETAMQRANISNAGVNYIIKLTADYIRKADFKVYGEIINKNLELPLAQIIEFIFKGNVSKIDIITTNYDCLIEYACDIARVAYSTGFSGGYCKIFNLAKENALYSPQFISGGSKGKIRTTRNIVPHVNILKLHGSIDWFTDGIDKIALNKYTESSQLSPLVVAPGLRKYEDTHHSPYREIIGLSDEIIRQGKSYLIIGYGFNDKHLEELLIPKIRNQSNKVILLTKEVSSSARELLVGTKNTLIVSQEGDGDMTRCYFNEEEIVIHQPIWKLDIFTKVVIGEGDLDEYNSTIG